MIGKKLASIGIGLGISVFIICLIPSKQVSAGASQQYPNGGVVADVATSGGNSNLNAPNSYFEVADDVESNPDVYIDACNGRNALASIAGNSNVKSSNANCENARPDNKGCGGTGWSKCIVLRNVGLRYNATLYKNKLATAYIHVRAGESGQHITFKVATDKGSVTFRGDPERNRDNSTIDTNSSFGVFGENDQPNSTGPNLQFDFTPTCDFVDKSKVFLKWNDADAGSSVNPYQPVSGFGWRLFDVTNGEGNKRLVDSRFDHLGGPNDRGVQRNHEFSQSKGNALEYGHKYSWRWVGLKNTNALQVSLPFSEHALRIFGNGDPCGRKKPKPNTIGNLIVCAENKRNRFTVGGYDPDNDNASVRFWIKSGGQTVLGGDGDVRTTNRGNDTLRTYTGFEPGRKYNLYIKDINDVEGDPWRLVDTDTDDTYPFDCGGSPGGPAFGATCSVAYVKNDERYTRPDGTVLTGGKIRSKIQFTGTDRSPTTDVYYPGGSGYAYGFRAAAKTVSVTVTRQYLNKNNNWINYSGPTTITHTCYQARCYVRGVENANDKNRPIVDTEPIKVVVRLANINTDSAALPLVQNVIAGDNHRLSLTEPPGYGHGFVPHYVDPGYTPIAPGESRDIEVTLPSPGAGVTTHTVSFFPDYENGIGNLDNDACRASVSVARQFQLRTGIIFNQNMGGAPATAASGEDLGRLGFTTRTYAENGAPVYGVPVTSSFTRNGVPVNPYNYSGSNNYLSNYSVSNPILGGSYETAADPAGTQYCLIINLPYDTGLVRGGNVIPGTTSVTNTFGSPTQTYSVSSQCITLHNKPYFQVLNGSVSAGGAFSGACGSTGGVLAGYNNWRNTSSPNYGSGADFSAFARLANTGVGSSRLPGGNAGRLALSNVSGVSPGGPSPRIGGDFGAAYCFNKVPVPSSATKSTGNTTISGRTVSAGEAVAFDVAGNAYINGNIQYNGAGWGVGSVPSFTLRATGNIYISGGVTALSGKYVAGGKIYTCASGFTPVSASNAYNSCKNQLTVHGTFTASQINLMRTFGSLRNASADRPYNGSRAGGCANQGAGNSLGYSCAAEVFIYSPELFLDPPTGTTAEGKSEVFEAITSLPPIL